MIEQKENAQKRSEAPFSRTRDQDLSLLVDLHAKNTLIPTSLNLCTCAQAEFHCKLQGSYRLSIEASNGRMMQDVRKSEEF